MPDVNDLQITLRQASPADHAVIVEFNEGLALESEGRQLDRRLLAPGVERVLADATLGQYYLAETAGEVIGQLMITLEWSDWRCGHFWWIQSVYVRPSWRRQGVFSRLYRHVLDAARSRQDVCGLRLYVEHDNTRAQATYAALGMHATGYRLMEVDFRQ
ncbi:MAG: GNAT family N-acetyltransferase [Gammaproteobacteria bacterium]|nr:GNAT family N-acetyltransferase [Gammaproteobacteria bacterium]